VSKEQNNENVLNYKGKRYIRLFGSPNSCDNCVAYGRVKLCHALFKLCTKDGGNHIFVLADKEVRK